jgi:hypothetical protein
LIRVVGLVVEKVWFLLTIVVHFFYHNPAKEEFLKRIPREEIESYASVS